MPPELLPLPIPDRGAVAERLDRYHSLGDRRAELDRRLGEVDRQREAVASALQSDVGDEAVILHRGMAHVPYASTGSGRRGYDRMPCLDLDALPLKPVVTIAPASFADRPPGANGVGPADVIGPRD